MPINWGSMAKPEGVRETEGAVGAAGAEEGFEWGKPQTSRMLWMKQKIQTTAVERKSEAREVGFEVLGDLRSGRMKRMAKPRRRGARAMPAVRRPRRGFLDQKMERVR